MESGVPEVVSKGTVFAQCDGSSGEVSMLTSDTNLGVWVEACNHIRTDDIQCLQRDKEALDICAGSYLNAIAAIKCCACRARVCCTRCASRGGEGDEEGEDDS